MQLALGAIALLLARGAHADDAALEQAKASFKAGAAAYAAGDYLAAIQALDAAYRATPLPAIAFSLAQAERRQYFVSHAAPHLARAISLYRSYLTQVPIGGRRADAADALAQLEPLALTLTEPASAVSVLGPPAPEQTRLLVTSRAPDARISLDAGAPVASPLIAEVPPGPHDVHVEAEGFFPEDRRVVAVLGALVPAELELRERPAILVIQGATGADVYADGRLLGRAERRMRLELASGPHSFIFAKAGMKLERTSLSLARGEERNLIINLHNTKQRSASLILMASGGAVMVAGAWSGLSALGSESDASRILRQRDTRALTPQELSDYRAAVRQRNQVRTVSIVTLVLGGAAVLTGLALFELDQPNLAEALRTPRGDAEKKPRFALAPAAEGLGLDARFRF